MACLVVSYLMVSYLVVSFLVVSYLVVSCLVVSHMVVSYIWWSPIWWCPVWWSPVWWSPILWSPTGFSICRDGEVGHPLPQSQRHHRAGARLVRREALHTATHRYNIFIPFYNHGWSPRKYPVKTVISKPQHGGA